MDATTDKNQQSRLIKDPDTAVRGVEAGNSVVRPNMLMSNARATSSTFTQNDFDHCVFYDSTFANSLFAQLNLVGTAFEFCSMDGAIFEQSSLRNAELRECDTTGLVINGINVGTLLEELTRKGEVDGA